MQQITDWLKKLGMSEYRERFVENDVDISVLPHLTDQAQAAARTLGLEVVTLEIRRTEDIAPAFDALKGRGDALYVTSDPFVDANRALR